MPSLGAEPCAALCDVVTEGRRPLRIGVDVAVLPNDKGQGLYALRDIEAGTLLERYRGILMEEDEYQASSSTGHYAMGLANGKIVDEPMVQDGIIITPAAGRSRSLTNATFAATTEVYPDSKGVTADECNRAQVAAATAGLDFIVANHL